MSKYVYEIYAIGEEGKPAGIWDLSNGMPGRLVADLRNATTQEAKVMFESLRQWENQEVE